MSCDNAENKIDMKSTGNVNKLLSTWSNAIFSFCGSYLIFAGGKHLFFLFLLRWHNYNGNKMAIKCYALSAALHSRRNLFTW